jgi:hypothetical protein
MKSRVMVHPTPAKVNDCAYRERISIIRLVEQPRHRIIFQ